MTHPHTNRDPVRTLGADDVTLVLEASTAAGSVALLRGGRAVQRVDVTMGASREDALFPAVQGVLGAAGVVASDVDAIALGSGPGSFTSLRIAAAVAKGLAHGTGARLYAVPSLLLAAATQDAPGRYLVYADALRGERYALEVTIDDQGWVRADGDVRRVPAAALGRLAGDRTPLAVGGTEDGADDARVTPDAACLPRVADWRGRRVSIDTWEPDYGRLAEAQVKWEAAHDRALPIG